MVARLPAPVTETNRAAPSKAVSGTATTSASGDSARAISALQPDTRTLQVSTSVTMALSATRETTRSEGHTSELQSRSDLVCRLLLEKKKKNSNRYSNNNQNKNQSTTQPDD